MTSDHDGAPDAAPFAGVGVALVTLFDENNQLDAESSAVHASRLIELGVSAILVGGTAGEFSFLTQAERNQLLEAVVKRVDDAVCVIAGVAAPTTQEACDLTSSARDLGASCILSTPTAEGKNVQHFLSVKQVAGNLPVLAYQWPDRYPPGITTAELQELPVVGCKDSSGDPKRLLDEVTKTNKAVYTGSSSLPLLCSKIGGHGAILGAANAFPELCIAAFDGDGEAQRKLHMAQDAVRSLPSPLSIKQMAAERFGTSVYSRLQ